MALDTGFSDIKKNFRKLSRFVFINDWNVSLPFGTLCTRITQQIWNVKQRLIYVCYARVTQQIWNVEHKVLHFCNTKITQQNIWNVKQSI